MRGNTAILIGLLTSLGFAQGGGNHWDESQPMTAAIQARVLQTLCAGKIDVKLQSCAPRASLNANFPLLTLGLNRLTGPFTAAGAKETIVNWSYLSDPGTETQFGGTGLLDANLKLKFVQPTWLEDCAKFRRSDGRDLLVCDRVGSGQGFEEETVSAVEILPSKTLETELVSLVSNVGACSDPAKEFELNALQKRDLNGDGRPDLRLIVTAKRAPNPNCDVDMKKVAQKSFTLSFFFDGKRLKPDAASARTIAGF